MNNHLPLPPLLSMLCIDVRFYCRWTALPNMRTAQRYASAICVKQTPDVVLVVGGSGERNLNCVELLYGDATQARHLHRCTNRE